MRNSIFIAGADKKYGIDYNGVGCVQEVYALVEPCVGIFIDSNKTLLMNSVLIAGGPLILYMAYRMVKGLTRAMKGYRLTNSKTWF